MSEILIEGFSIEEAFKALCEHTEITLQPSDSKYYLVIANKLGFDLEFYAKQVNRLELISEIVRYIDLDSFDTSADILLELQEDEFEKAIEDLCTASAGANYLEDVGILIKNKDGKVISGVDFTLSLIDELQDYEAGNDIIQKLKNQEPFTFTFERDIGDYGDFVVENVENSNDELLTEATKKQLDSFAVKVKKALGGKFKVVGNSRTQCADILDGNENIIGQAYPKIHTIETEHPITFKRLICIQSIDDIQPDDEIYVKRSEKSNMKKVADQIDYIKMVHGIVDSADAFIASVDKATDADDLVMDADNQN